MRGATKDWVEGRNDGIGWRNNIAKERKERGWWVREGMMHL